MKAGQVHALDVRDVSVGYGGLPVIHDVSLHVEAGETFGLIGLNGAGKTSLIKAILGLRGVQGGAARIFGQPPEKKESRRNLAYLPERFDPPWFLSGMEFVRFSLRIYKQPFDKQEVLSYAEKLALDPKALGRRVQTYSKGMRQKLGLIATLLTRCRLMILDEPMSGLDPLARMLVKDLLVQEQSKGHTIFLSSHILSDMDELCGRIAIMHEGSLRFIGKPAEFKALTQADNLERAFLHFIEKKKAA